MLLDAPAWAAKPVKPPLPPPPPPPPAGVTYQIVWINEVYGVWPEGMNSWGDVVGDSYPYGDSLQAAFLYTEDAGAVDLNTLVSPGTGMWLSSALDINDEGQIVGAAIVNGERHGYRYTPAYESSGVQYPAVVQDLGKLAPDDKSTMAYSINEAGEVCGAGTRADGTSYSYYYTDGQPAQPVLLGTRNDEQFASCWGPNHSLLGLACWKVTCHLGTMGAALLLGAYPSRVVIFHDYRVSQISQACLGIGGRHNRRTYCP
jgi:probable HAF family extracellular repeat protein